TRHQHIHMMIEAKSEGCFIKCCTKTDITTCLRCRQMFYCDENYAQHRLDLSQQLEQLIIEKNNDPCQTQQYVSIENVDEWERCLFVKIQLVAKQVKQMSLSHDI
ncbi:unnamed protein product, partial [Rotaria sp. Silwood2]